MTLGVGQVRSYCLSLLTLFVYSQLFLLAVHCLLACMAGTRMGKGEGKIGRAPNFPPSLFPFLALVYCILVNSLLIPVWLVYVIKY